MKQKWLCYNSWLIDGFKKALLLSIFSKAEIQNKGFWFSWRDLLIRSFICIWGLFRESLLFGFQRSSVDKIIAERNWLVSHTERRPFFLEPSQLKTFIIGGRNDMYRVCRLSKIFIFQWAFKKHPSLHPTVEPLDLLLYCQFFLNAVLYISDFLPCSAKLIS